MRVTIVYPSFIFAFNDVTNVMLKVFEFNPDCFKSYGPESLRGEGVIPPESVSRPLLINKTGDGYPMAWLLALSFVNAQDYSELSAFLRAYRFWGFWGQGSQ